MNRFIKKLGIGIIILFLFDLTVGTLLKSFYFTQSSGFQYRSTYSLEETDQEGLIFGSSRANYHYRPDILKKELNKTFYNTGREGLFIFYQTAVLKAVLKRYTPKTIIYDFSGTFEYNQNDYDKLSALLPYYDDHEELRDIVNLRSRFEPMKNVSKIYPYNSTLINILSGNIGLAESDNSLNGYMQQDNVWGKKLDTIQFPKRYALDSNKLKLFKKFIELAQNHDIDLYVTYSPVFYQYKSDYSVEICKEICEEKGVPFLDFSKEAAFLNQNTLFSDPEHLNGEGAEKFTKIVAAAIKTGQFP